MTKKLITLIILSNLIFGSGGFDNGTSNGKGKFQLDLTWNPFNKFVNGQSYGVISYGITNKFDIHGYISYHPEDYYTYYCGVFYQLLKTDRIDIATATGIRLRKDKTFDIFSPQLLYTIRFSNNVSLGGSFVNIINYNESRNYGVTIDSGLFYKTKYKSKSIESISVGVGLFHPKTWEPESLLLPTYSIDIKFN